MRSKDEVLVGFRERIDRRFVARMNSCVVLRPPAGDLIAPLATLIQELSIRASVPQVEVAVGDDACVLAVRVLEPPTGGASSTCARPPRADRGLATKSSRIRAGGGGGYRNNNVYFINN